MPKFKVKGLSSIISAGDEYRPGDTIELPEQVALEFRGQLEPADKEAEAVFAPPKHIEAELKGRRAHERVAILKAWQARLKEELATVNEQLKEAEAEEQKDAAKANKKSEK